MSINKSLIFGIIFLSAFGIAHGAESKFTFKDSYLKFNENATTEDLKTALSKNAQILRLGLSSCTEIDFDNQDLNWSRCTDLTHLYLSSTNITAQGLQKILNACLHLKKLNLSLCAEIDFDNQVLDWTQCPDLIDLDLYGTKITFAGLKKILSACPHLEFLELSSCDNLDKKYQKYLSESAITQLREQFIFDLFPDLARAFSATTA